MRGATASPPPSQIAELENGGTKIGLVAIDTKTEARIEQRASERFPMCSTFKLLAVGAVLHRVDRGKEKLDRFIPYTEKDLLEYAPVTRQHVHEGGMKLEALCQAAIEQSDNTAGNLLLQTIGGPNGITKFARSIGDDVTRLDRMEPELNDWKPGDERDTTTAAAMCEDLRRLLESDLLSKESRKLLDGWLQHNETGVNLVRAGVPRNWRVGDKTGRSGNGATNDVAVMYPADGAPIYIAIYTFGGSDEQRSAAIASVARKVCEIFRPAH
jgi:beta-lactamase class A